LIRWVNVVLNFTSTRAKLPLKSFSKKSIVVKVYLCADE
jgi:hypothetical protein